jgi:hypothetical protein
MSHNVEKGLHPKVVTYQGNEVTTSILRGSILMLLAPYTPVAGSRPRSSWRIISLDSHWPNEANRWGIVMKNVLGCACEVYWVERRAHLKLKGINIYQCQQPFFCDTWQVYYRVVFILERKENISFNSVKW